MSSSDALAELMRLWSAGSDIIERGHLNETARRLLGGRFALLQLQADDETLAIRDWGRAFGSFDERWCGCRRGSCSKISRTLGMPPRPSEGTTGGPVEATRAGRM
jgi:hypothetical protein